jgi:hypothetical protein
MHRALPDLTKSVQFQVQIVQKAQPKLWAFDVNMRVCTINRFNIYK